MGFQSSPWKLNAIILNKNLVYQIYAKSLNFFVMLVICMYIEKFEDKMLA